MTVDCVAARISELLSIMARLRAPGGCAWDREQTFASIAPYTIEEAYEVADAIDRGDLPHLKEELGDLLLQVVFHAQMAQEAGEFGFDEVVTSICEKLVRRHPHVFGGAAALTADEQIEVWEKIKAHERGAAAASAPTVGDGAASGVATPDVATPGVATPGALDGVPLALPALMRAGKLSKRAARVGFDFEHHGQTADKVQEELAEVREAAAARSPGPPSREIFEEVGDLLFAAANLARKLDVDAEEALRAANAKFERRFRAMEALAASRGESFEGLNLAAQERLWSEVKRAE